MMKTIFAMLVAMTMALGCAETGDGEEAPSVDVGGLAPKTFCTNGQCFDGGDGPPKGNGVDSWTLQQCRDYCYCGPECKNYCHSICG